MLDNMHEPKLWAPYLTDQPLDLSYTTGFREISSSSQTPSPSLSPAGSSSASSLISPSVSPAGSSSGSSTKSLSVNLAAASIVSPVTSPSVSPRANRPRVSPYWVPERISPSVSPTLVPYAAPCVSHQCVCRAGPSIESPAGPSTLSPVISPEVSPMPVPYAAPCVQGIDQGFAVASGQNRQNDTSWCPSPQLPSTAGVLLLMSYAEYEKEALSLLARSNGGSLVTNNPQMRRAVKTKRNADPDYLKQREKNNKAAKKSRDLRKFREHRLSIQITYLEKVLGQILNHMCTYCKTTFPLKHVPGI